MNRKKGSDATVDKREIKKGDPAKTLIIQVAVVPWTTTRFRKSSRQPRVFLNAGFRSAAQLEFVLMIGDEALHPVTNAGLRSFRNFVPKDAFTRYCS